jgi:hypothetical protein
MWGRAAKAARAQSEAPDPRMLCLFPGKANLLGLMKPPNSQVGLVHPNDQAHALGFRVERRVAQKPPNEVGNQFVDDVEENQAIIVVAQITSVEIAVLRKEGWPIQLMQQRNQCVIHHPHSPDIKTDMANSYSPTAQSVTLIDRNILIEDIHVG